MASVPLSLQSCVTLPIHSLIFPPPAGNPPPQAPTSAIPVTPEKPPSGMRRQSSFGGSAFKTPSAGGGVSARDTMGTPPVANTTPQASGEEEALLCCVFKMPSAGSGVTARDTMGTPPVANSTPQAPGEDGALLCCKVAKCRTNASPRLIRWVCQLWPTRFVLSGTANKQLYGGTSTKSANLLGIPFHRFLKPHCLLDSASTNMCKYDLCKKFNL